MLRRLRRIPGHLRPRRMRVYGVGVGKSGTTTLARMFGRYRAAHEVDARRMLPIGASIMTGDLDVTSGRVRAELRRRSWRFHLEVDSAPFLNPFTPTLVEMFDDARFVLILRDCFSWLDSRVEWERSHPSADIPMFAPFRAALYRHHDDEFTAYDAVLQQAGLRPISSYLRSWAERNAAVVNAVPGARLLVVRTEDLDHSAATLARFVGVPEGSVTAVHANHNPNRAGLLSGVSPDFIIDQADEHCRELMASYWGPDWTDLAERLPR